MTNTNTPMKPTTSGKSAAAGDAEQAITDARNANLIIALRQYQQAHNLTDAARDLRTLASRMGTSDTYLFRYLKNDFKGSLAKFEEKLAAFLSSDHEAKVEANAEIIAQDFIVAGMKAFLRQVKAHGFIGVGHGPAGRGKTYAAKLYAAQHPTTAIYLHATCWSCGRHELTRSLARAMQLVRPPKGVNLDEALVAKLGGSDRLVIIDNAHRLTEGARRWLADFWDTARLPIALIGNPEIERQWQRNDQHGSRVGLHRDVTLDLGSADKPGTTAKATALHLLRLHLPEAADLPEVVADATRSLPGFGGCRAVVMRSRLAANILSGGRVTDPAEAWKLARTQLITAA
jgi:hypothetical protein